MNQSADGCRVTLNEQISLTNLILNRGVLPVCTMLPTTGKAHRYARLFECICVQRFCVSAECFHSNPGCACSCVCVCALFICTATLCVCVCMRVSGCLCVFFLSQSMTTAVPKPKNLVSIYRSHRLFLFANPPSLGPHFSLS